MFFQASSIHVFKKISILLNYNFQKLVPNLHWLIFNEFSCIINFVHCGFFFFFNKGIQKNLSAPENILVVTSYTAFDVYPSKP